MLNAYCGAEKWCWWAAMDISSTRLPVLLREVMTPQAVPSGQADPVMTALVKALVQPAAPSRLAQQTAPALLTLPAAPMAVKSRRSHRLASSMPILPSLRRVKRRRWQRAWRERQNSKPKRCEPSCRFRQRPMTMPPPGLRGCHCCRLSRRRLQSRATLPPRVHWRAGTGRPINPMLRRRALSSCW